MISKIIKKLYAWIVRREYRKRLKQQEKKQREIYKKLRDLYQFVRWLNANFANRREKKAFWRAVMEGRPVLEKTLEDLAKRYEVKKEEKKKVILKGYQPKGNENEEFEPPKGGSGIVK